jgi:AcrR family transcriptional regulator
MESGGFGLADGRAGPAEHRPPAWWTASAAPRALRLQAVQSQRHCSHGSTLRLAFARQQPILRLTPSIFGVTIGDMNVPVVRKERRPYRMEARARAVEATTRRMLEQAFELFTEKPYEDVSLDEVAHRSGVTKRTVLRRFGAKEHLFAAAMDLASQEIRRHRWEAPIGDIAGAVRNVVDGYERWGANHLRLISQEDRIPVVREMVERGRRGHREWVQRTFAPLLKGLGNAARRRRLIGLIAITDVYTWKLLRLDLGLSQAETERTLTDLIDALKGGA